MDLIIREACVDDAAAVLGVLNPIIASEAVAFDAPLTVADERSYIAAFPSRGVFHVALRDGELVGFQSLELFATSTHLLDHVGVLGTYVAATHRRAASITAAKRRVATPLGISRPGTAMWMRSSWSVSCRW